MVRRRASAAVLPASIKAACKSASVPSSAVLDGQYAKMVCGAMDTVHVTGSPAVPLHSNVTAHGAPGFCQLRIPYLPEAEQREYARAQEKALIDLTAAKGRLAQARKDVEAMIIGTKNVESIQEQ